MREAGQREFFERLQGGEIGRATRTTTLETSQESLLRRAAQCSRSSASVKRRHTIKRTGSRKSYGLSKGAKLRASN